jgi:hypothetical protein
MPSSTTTTGLTILRDDQTTALELTFEQMAAIIAMYEGDCIAASAHVRTLILQQFPDQLGPRNVAVFINGYGECAVIEFYN